MILRKPYAFLIKNFRLIHIIITIFMAYIFYKSLNVLSVFNKYFISNSALIGTDMSSMTYTFLMFLSPIIIIILSIILFWVMTVKKKPNKLYLINIITYIFILVMFIMGKSTMAEMEKIIVDVRFVKVIRDLTTFAFIFQILPIAKSLVRSVGFDIKEFDFGKDLEELEIEEKDSEEFEVNVSVDTNKIKRNLNFRRRNIKYAIKENKALVIIASSIFILIVGLIILFAITRGTKKGINQAFTVSSFNIKVTNAYVTRQNYKGVNIEKLNDQMSLVIIPFQIKNNSILDKGLPTANIMLDVKGHRFRNTITYRDDVYDLGKVYNGEDIVTKTTEYRTLIFEIPTEYLNKKMYLRFESSLTIKGKNVIPTYISVPITPYDLDTNKSTNVINSNEDIELKQTVLKDSILNISNIEIAKRFRIDYTYQVGGRSIPSYEYISAPLETNVDRSLLKITGNVTLDEKVNLNNLYDIINYYGVVKYTIGDKVKTISSLPKILPSKTNPLKSIYIAIPSEIEEATEASLVLNIRGRIYTYIIK